MSERNGATSAPTSTPTASGDNDPWLPKIPGQRKPGEGSVAQPAMSEADRLAHEFASYVRKPLTSFERRDVRTRVAQVRGV